GHVPAELEDADLPTILGGLEVHVHGDSDLRDVRGEPEGVAAVLQGPLAPVLAAAHRAVEDSGDGDEHQDVGGLRDRLEEVTEDPAIPGLSPHGRRCAHGDEQRRGDNPTEAFHEHGLRLGSERSSFARYLPSGTSRSPLPSLTAASTWRK